jgi:hypothetical protein
VTLSVLKLRHITIRKKTTEFEADLTLRAGEAARLQSNKNTLLNLFAIMCEESQIKQRISEDINTISY